MNRHLVAGVLSCCAAVVLAAGPAAEAPASARAVCAELGVGLRTRLMAAVASNGVTGALAVCKDIAPAMAAELSAKHGLRVRRTALRVRNQDNQADAWEQKVLAMFAARAAAGEPMPTLEHSETVEGADGLREIRYMKAIPMEPVCVTCHGAVLAPELSAEVARLYPADAATGFSPGEVRGAFSVVLPAP